VELSERGALSSYFHNKYVISYASLRRRTHGFVECAYRPATPVARRTRQPHFTDCHPTKGLCMLCYNIILIS